MTGVEAQALVRQPDGTVLVGPDRGPVRVPLDLDWVPSDHRLVEAVRKVTGVTAHLTEPLDDAAFLLTAPGGRPADGYRWVSPRRVKDRTTREWLERDAPPRELPWLAPGWMDTATAWIDATLDGLGRPRTGPVEHVQHWALSTVLRVPTGSGACYFKAVPETLSTELAVIDTLGAPDGAAASGPVRVPTVLARHAEHPWWLAEDFGGAPATESARSAETVLAGVAELQVSLAGGDRPPAVAPQSLEQLADRAGELLREEELWANPGRPSGPLSDQDRRATRLAWGDFALRLQDQCLDLADLGFPDTLTHGDLHVDNAVCRRQQVVVFDWSFAGWSHPVLDLGPWLHRAPEAAVPRQVQVFVQPWREVVGQVAASRAWRVGRPVAALREAAKFVDLAELVGPRYDFQMWPMAYRWISRLASTWAPDA